MPDLNDSERCVHAAAIRMDGTETAQDTEAVIKLITAAALKNGSVDFDPSRVLIELVVVLP